MSEPEYDMQDVANIATYDSLRAEIERLRAENAVLRDMLDKVAKYMFAEGKPDLVVAFPRGKGTADMARRAKVVGVKIVEI